MRKFALAFLLAASVPTAFADTEVVDGIEWTYTVFGNEAVIGGSYDRPAVSKSTTGALAIPATLSGLPVTGIGDYAFYDCSGLTDITIPDSVVSIGWDAFRFCSALVSLTIPASVEYIGDWAFGGCFRLEAIAVDEDNPVFDSRNGCNAIIETSAGRLVAGCKNTVIPDGVGTIGNYSFNRCYGLTSVSFPGSVTNIEHYAFSGCTGLSTVAIPENVTEISPSAFAGCSGLTSFSVSADNPAFMSTNGCLLSKDGTKLVHGINGDITIPTGVTTIGAGAFDGCSGLTSITIPEGVTRIGDNAFRDCSSLASITIPEGVTSIGGSAFLDCSSLASITIPDSVATIGDYPFKGCNGLTAIVIPYAFSSVLSELFWDLPASCQITIGSRRPLVLATDAVLPDAREGFDYKQGFEATGGLRPYSFEFVDNADNPSWMRWKNWILVTEDGLYDGFLDGCPESSDIGTNSFTLRATDAEGASVEKTFTLVVRPGIAWTPKPKRFRIDPGTSVTFSGIASDPGIEGLSFGWGACKIVAADFEEWIEIPYVTPESFTFDSSIYGEGRYRISAWMNDGEKTASHSWTVTVAPKTPLAIETDAVLPSAKICYNYEQEIVITGGEQPYAIEIVDRDAWPDWLDPYGIEHWEDYSFDPILRGWPDNDDVGTYSFTLRVTDAVETIVEKTFTIVVEENTPPVISAWTPEAPRFRIDPNATTNFTVTASDPDGDSLWFYWEIGRQTEDGWFWFEEIESSESFTFNPTNYGAGRYRIGCWASDGCSSDWHSWIVTVASNMPLAFATESDLPPARAGSYRQEIKIVGGVEPYSVEIVDRDAWPDWLDSDYIDRWDEWEYADPILEGWPDNDDVGTYFFALRVTDAEGTSVAKTFTVVVASNSPPVIDSWAPETTRFRIHPGLSTNFTVTASDPDGDELSYRWTVLRSVGGGAWEYYESDVAYGSGSFAFHSYRYGEGLYRIEVAVDDGAYSESQSWSVTVAGDSPLAIAMGSDLPSIKAYWHYRQDLKIVGGKDPYAVQIVNRENGAGWLYVNRWSDSWGNVWFSLGGNPSGYDVGENTFTLRVTDAEGTSVEKTFTVLVLPNAEPVIESWTPQTTRFRIDSGVFTNFAVVASDADGDELSYRWSVWRHTDDGWDWIDSPSETETCSFDSSVLGEGRYEVSVSVSDGGNSQERSWIVTVGEKTPLAIKTATLPVARTGWWYYRSVEATGGEEPYTWEIVNSDDWPNGLWMGDFTHWEENGRDNPCFRGYPSEDAIGTNSITVRVTDAEGTSVTNTFTLVVERNDAPAIESWTPEADVFRISPGSMTNFTVTAFDPDGDELSYYWDVYVWDGDGLSWLDGPDDVDSIPFNSSKFGEGEYRITVRVADGGHSVSRSWNVLVAEKTPLGFVTDSMLPAMRTKRPNDYQSVEVEATGGEIPYTWDVVDCSDSPTWLRWDPQGTRFVFSGCPSIFHANVAGERFFTLCVTDSEGTSVTNTFTLVVEAWTYFTPDPVPYAWLERYYADLGPLGDYCESLAFEDAANGENKIWECYVAGLCPTNAADRFLATIGFDENGGPVVSWTPDLNEGGTKSVRVYTVEGKANLGDESWGPTNAASRFFRVKVSMP